MEREKSHMNKGLAVQEDSIYVHEGSLPKGHWFLNNCLEHRRGSGSAHTPIPAFESNGFGSDAAFMASLGCPIGQPAIVYELSGSEKFMEASHMYMGVSPFCFVSKFPSNSLVSFPRRATMQ